MRKTGCLGIEAAHGSYFLELDASGSGAIDGIYQALQTVKDRKYLLRINVRSRGSMPFPTTNQSSLSGTARRQKQMDIMDPVRVGRNTILLFMELAVKYDFYSENRLDLDRNGVTQAGRSVDIHRKQPVRPR